MSPRAKVVEAVVPRLAPAEGSVYLTLYQLAEEGRCCISHSRLAAACDISLSTLKRALKGLESWELVEQAQAPNAPTTFTVHVKSLDELPS